MKPQSIQVWDVCVTKWVRGVHGFSTMVVGFSGNTWPRGSSLPVGCRARKPLPLWWGRERPSSVQAKLAGNTPFQLWPLLASVPQLTLCTQLLKAHPFSKWRQDGDRAPQRGWKPWDQAVMLLMPTTETGIGGTRGHKQNRTCKSQEYQDLDSTRPRIFLCSCFIFVTCFFLFYVRTSLEEGNEH